MKDYVLLLQPEVAVERTRFEFTSPPLTYKMKVESLY